MMIVEKTLGNIEHTDMEGKMIDPVVIEWHEAGRRILKKTTRGGTEIGMRFEQGHTLNDGDILWMDRERAVVVEVAESDCISLSPEDACHMGIICYELGNMHAPLCIRHGLVLTPYDEPLYLMLKKKGFRPERKKAKLNKAMGGHSHGHAH